MRPELSEKFSEQLVHFAQGHLGFTRVGVLPVEPAYTFPQFGNWLDHGYEGEMAWLYTEGRKDKRSDVRAILPNAKSVITLAYTYRTSDLPEHILNDPSRGVFARYTWGRDYHKVIKHKLLDLILYLQEELGDTFTARAYVDTGPILERELAQRAGIGFVGNNSMLISSQFGSYIFLCEIIIDQHLKPITYKPKGGCRTCTKCIISCPTHAILNNKTIDARKCISYLTIESKTSIPEELRPLMKNRIYGCDICQEVCPWNGTAQAKQTLNDWLTDDLEHQAPKLTELAYLNDDAFLQRFQGSPIMRAKRTGLLRNVAVALGNWGSVEATVALEHLAKDDSELIRSHALWGLKQAAKLAIQ